MASSHVHACVPDDRSKLQQRAQRLCFLQLARRIVSRCMSGRHNLLLTQIRSWGTKGSDKVEALPAATSKKEDGQDAVVEVQEKKQAGAHACSRYWSMTDSPDWQTSTRHSRLLSCVPSRRSTRSKKRRSRRWTTRTRRSERVSSWCVAPDAESGRDISSS